MSIALRLLVVGSLLASAPGSLAADADAIEEARLAVRTKRFAQALESLRAPALRENPEAQYLLGLALCNGVGQSVDREQSLARLRFAAGHGHVAAAHALSAMLAAGSAPEKQEAATWLAKALKSGYLPAQGATGVSLPLADARNAALPEDLRFEIARFAVRNDDVDLLAAVLARPLAARRGAFGRTLLAEAAAAGSHKAAVVLLGAGADAQEADEAGVTPLMLAAATGEADLSRRLLAAGARVDAADAFGRTALMRAAAANQAEQVVLLLGSGAVLARVDSMGYAATDIAMQSGAAESLAALRAAGGVATRAVPVRFTVGIDATRVGLLQQGWPPLLVAASRDDAADIRQRVAAGASPDATSPQGASALQVAIESRAVAAAAALLELGADPQRRGRDGLNARELALRSGDAKLFAVFFPADKPLAAAEAAAMLGIAVDRGDEVAVRALIARGADARAANTGGLTPLHRAARLGEPALIKLLLDRGADPAATDDRGRSAVWYAVAARSSEALDILLAVHAPAAVADREGTTPLMLAARAGDDALARRLLAAGVARDPKAREAPLRTAAALGHAVIVELLLSRESSLDAADTFGETALMAAARSGHEKVCSMLLAAGANPRLRNRERATAADLAESRGFHSLAEKLRS